MLAFCVRSPFAELLVSGEKILEIRRWSFPIQFFEKEIGVIQTSPGKPSLLIGSVQFNGVSLIQTEKDFLSLSDKHKILEYPEIFTVEKFPVFAWHVKQATTFKNAKPIKGFLGIKKINPSSL